VGLSLRRLSLRRLSLRLRLERLPRLRRLRLRRLLLELGTLRRLLAARFCSPRVISAYGRAAASDPPLSLSCRAVRSSASRDHSWYEPRTRAVTP
jgi:hypothetical protein